MDLKHTPLKHWGVLALTFALLLPAAGNAQKKYSVSAEQAAQLALKNVTELKNLQIDRQLQLAKNRELIAQALPQVSGSVSSQHFFSIPVTLLPDFISPSVYQVLVDKGVKDGSGNPITKPTAAPQFFPAQFGVPWQSSAGVQFQQLLFQPDLFIAIQARQKAVDLTEANIAVMEDSVKSNVMRSYYSVLIAKKRKDYLDSSINRLKKLRTDQEKLFKNGFAEKLDIDKTQVTLNNLMTTSNQIANLIGIGEAALKFAMAIDQQDTLELTDVLAVEMVRKDLLSLAGFNYEDRKEIKTLNIVQDLQGLDVKRNKLAYLPTVASYWSYSRNALGQSFNLFSFNQKWFKSSVVGINLNIPIFDAGQKAQRLKQARLNLEKTSNTIENVKRAIDLQVKASTVVFNNALSSLEMQERNLQLAEKVYNTTKKKYEQGLGSSFELLQTQTELENAESNYFQSLYDAVNARISYAKAIGKL